MATTKPSLATQAYDQALTGHSSIRTTKPSLATQAYGSPHWPLKHTTKLSQATQAYVRPSPHWPPKQTKLLEVVIDLIGSTKHLLEVYKKMCNIWTRDDILLRKIGNFGALGLLVPTNTRLGSSIQGLNPHLKV